MIAYIGKRLVIMLPTLVLIMAVGFVIMQLPAQDYVDQYVARQGLTGNTTAMLQEELLRQQLGLDRPPVERFFTWLFDFVRGDWGNSFVDSRPVTTIILERLPATLGISALAFILSWGVGIPPRTSTGPATWRSPPSPSSASACRTSSSRCSSSSPRSSPAGRCCSG